MKELVGRTVKSLLVNEDQSQLVFDTTTGDVTYIAYGDCCSETWFADITGVDYLLGAVVVLVTEVPLASDVADGRSRQEYDEVYGVKLTTNKGHVSIIYRNSSNGYYGGYVEYVENTNRPLGLVEITGDWNA